MRQSRGRINRLAPGFPWVIDRTTGRVFGSVGSCIIYSDDKWTTARLLADIGRVITVLYRTSAGTLICGTGYPGQVFRITSNGRVTKVLDLPVGECAIWSINGAGTKVVVGEYGQKNAADPANNARRVFLSEDDGQTFTEIFAISAVNGVHVHAVAFDPYTNQIWVSHGDDQHGIYRLDPPSWIATQISSVQQPTSIIALHQDYVLFGSDYGELPNGIFRYTKASGVFERVFSLDSQHDQPFFACGYDTETQTAYFGTATMNTNIPYLSLWKSTPPFTSWIKIEELDRGVANNGYKSIIGLGNSVLIGFQDNNIVKGYIVNQWPVLRIKR